MMDELLMSVNKLTAEEKARADERFGPHKSLHEGFGVLAEEIQEFHGVACDLTLARLNGLLASIRVGDDPEIRCTLADVKRYAQLAAAEAIQVAAVCDRFMELVKKEES